MVRDFAPAAVRPEPSRPVPKDIDRNNLAIEPSQRIREGRPLAVVAEPDQTVVVPCSLKHAGNRPRCRSMSETSEVVNLGAAGGKSEILWREERLNSAW